MPTVAELEKRIDRHDERMDAIESSQSGMNEKMIRLDEKMNNSNNEMKRISDKVTEVAADVKTLIMKPGKKWESTTATILTAIISIVLGFLAAHILN